MKKKLIFLALCFISTLSFAETNNLQTTTTLNTTFQKVESSENIEFGINEFGFFSCTWTHVVTWRDQYGNYLGTTSATVTVNWGTSLDCAAAQHLAQQQAESMAP